MYPYLEPASNRVHDVKNARTAEELSKQEVRKAEYF